MTGCCWTCPQCGLQVPLAQGPTSESVELYPHQEEVDVLYAVNFHHHHWRESRAQVSVDLLNDHGIRASLCDISRQSRDLLISIAERSKTRVFVNSVMAIQHGRIENLAERFPKVQWLTTCHSSQSDLARNASWLKHQFDFLDLARRRHNCHYALVDERTNFYHAFDCRRLIHLSNCVPLPDVKPYCGLHDPPVVSLICEWRQLKNIPNQLVGLALAQKRRRFRVLLAIKNDRDGLAKTFAHHVGLDLDLRPWQSWVDYRRMVAEEIDVGLQVSFTESFNFVSLDHMLSGKPVIGSPAIRFLPEEWQANPDDPEDIAGRLVEILSCYQEASDTALRVSEAKARDSNAAYLTTMRGLLKGDA